MRGKRATDGSAEISRSRMMSEMQRDEADRSERRDRDERQRAELARDAATRIVRLNNGSRRQLDRNGFGRTCDGYGTSITCTMMNGRLPTLWMK